MSEKNTPPPSKESNRKNQSKSSKKTKNKKDRLGIKKQTSKHHRSVPASNHNSNTSLSKSNQASFPILQLSEPPNLEEEIRTIWSQPVDVLPVYKDLPRLARRIVILGSLKPTFSSNHSDNEEEGDNNNNTNIRVGQQTENHLSLQTPTSPNLTNVSSSTEPSSFELQSPQEILVRFVIYLNTTPVTTFRASNWPKTYKICKLKVYVEKEPNTVVIEIYSRDRQDPNKNETTICKCSIDNLRAVEDSSRYFVLQDVTSTLHEGVHNVGIAFYTREESTQFKEVIVKRSGKDVTLGNVLQERKAPSSRNLKQVTDDLTLEEKPIHEKQIKELDKETEKDLKILGSVRKNSETLNTLREKVNSRLSQMGTGQIVYHEDEQLANPTTIKLVNIHKLPQNPPNNLQTVTPRTPPPTRQKEHLLSPSMTKTSPRTQPPPLALPDLKPTKMSSEPDLIKTTTTSVSPKNKNINLNAVEPRQDRAMSFNDSKSTNNTEKVLMQFAPVTAEALDKAKDHRPVLIDLNLPRGPPPLALEADTQFSALIAIKKVIMGVAQQVEEESKQKEIEAALTNILETSYHGELELLVKELFTKTIGKDSKTARIFKVIHQGIIHSCTYQIKAKITSDLLTGDVRGPEGWQILILFANDVISISHRRRERSIDLTGPKDKFWFEWALHMTFDKDMKDLNAAVLKIVDLQISNNVDETEREKIKQRFCGGKLIIS